MSHKKVCPIKLASANRLSPYCLGSECAWWCAWEKECAIYATAAILKDGDT